MTRRRNRKAPGQNAGRNPVSAPAVRQSSGGMPATSGRRSRPGHADHAPGPTDIRPVKRELRQKYRALREAMDPVEKERYDQAIFERLVQLPSYQKARAILCFVSTAIEVDTLRILQRAFQDGKTVAVPKCLDRKGTMDFFVIRSLDDLTPGEFSLLEPDPDRVPALTQYQDSICILPAFAFDADGYRLGFGKGYYDRFLRRYTGEKIGICYNSCIAPYLPRGRYDETADYIVTPKYVLTVKRPREQRKQPGEEI